MAPAASALRIHRRRTHMSLKAAATVTTTTAGVIVVNIPSNTLEVPRIAQGL
jgi:hypothetical protein